MPPGVAWDPWGLTQDRTEVEAAARISVLWNLQALWVALGRRPSEAERLWWVVAAAGASLVPVATHLTCWLERERA